MAMNSSGPISLAGPVIGQSIALTIGRTATTTTSLNEPDVRTLAGVASGQISMPDDFYGKAWSANSATFFMMGGGGSGGGAGGGQMIGQNVGQNASVTKGTVYTVSVGGAGSSSSVFGYTAAAGGNGGSYAAKSCGNGGNGYCGGGAAVAYEAGSCSGGVGTSGNNGGNSVWRGYPSQDSLGGGGGGLGGSGGAANASFGSGSGGNGITSTFNPSGSATYYGGGAKGSILICTPGLNCNQGSDGAGVGPNTGGGGSSGVVIIRVSDQFQLPTTTGSPDFIQTGGYFWFTFKGTGTITF